MEWHLARETRALLKIFGHTDIPQHQLLGPNSQCLCFQGGLSYALGKIGTWFP